MTSYRVPGRGRLKNANRISFTFDGNRYDGLDGDTLASALLANGVHLTGRSFKYHRPRGILGHGSEEPNALVDISRDKARRQPNIRATMQPLYQGLVATSQNRFPTLDFDIGAVNGLFSRLLSAGFYYKTFMWPKSFWHKVYEPNIRSAAGLGKVPTEADPDRYANRFEHVDVVVVGGGPAGLTAALAAGESGASVILCDEGDAFGGWLKAESAVTIDGVTSADFVADAVARLKGMANVRVMPRTTAFGYYVQNYLALVAQDDAGTGLAGSKRRRQAGGATADDEHVGVLEAVGVGVGIGLRWRFAEAGGRADVRLVDVRPERLRPHESLVVEARRQEA